MATTDNLHSNNPLITVAMPVYNAGPFLRLAILSIINQSFTDWELLVIDDGSTDNALQSISDINDPRIKILSDGKNAGIAARLNECIKLAQGIYFARMDADDVSYPDRLEMQIKELTNDSSIDLIAGKIITIDQNNTPTGSFPCPLSHRDICASPWKGFHLPHPTWIGKIEWFRRNLYAIPAPYCCEDQEILLRTYAQSRFACIPETVLAYRVRTTTNWPKLSRTRRSVFAVQRKHCAQQRAWPELVLAGATFLARSIKDFVTKNLHKNYSPGNGRLNHNDVTEWYKIIENYTKNNDN